MWSLWRVEELAETGIRELRGCDREKNESGGKVEKDVGLR